MPERGIGVCDRMLGDLNSVKIDGACELGEGNELGGGGVEPLGNHGGGCKKMSIGKMWGGLDDFKIEE